jgi:hypothetical protein
MPDLERHHRSTIREFVERRPRLAERRSQLTEDGGDGGALGEQRLAAVEQTLGIVPGEGSADSELSAHPVDVLGPHDATVEQTFARQRVVSRYGGSCLSPTSSAVSARPGMGQGFTSGTARGDVGTRLLAASASATRSTTSAASAGSSPSSDCSPGKETVTIGLR